MREPEVARRTIEVSGIVQGVGFRPFVHGLASRMRLGGSVRNRTGTVLIEVEGEPRALDRFEDALTHEPPPLARIEEVRSAPAAPLGHTEFTIDPSDDDAPSTAAVRIAPDVATCDDCLRECLDPADRRHRYPFTNCTSCGPRLTIVTGAPYDRARTTMARFPMCEACRREYEDPRDRRFHAQPIACPACGPTLRMLLASGAPVDGDPIVDAARALLAGKIGAVKGIGGYHLACIARDDAAVAELRRRKHREEKPLALMVADVAAAEALCEVSLEERAMLASPARPIVLLRRRADAKVADGVAPGTSILGIMLPCLPLHHLLLREVAGPLVMTSGNRADEPIATDDGDARARLSDIADFFLVHDRPIESRCDDSIVRTLAGAPVQIRRSRGFAPEPIALPRALSMPTLAVGGQMKSVFALGDGRRAFLSQHQGELEHFEARRAFEAGIAQYERLFHVTPRRIVHDLHPDYASTHHALERARREGLEAIGVQHHHAHMAACMAENGLDGPAIGVTFDGTGCGLDGAVWGGEFLVGDCREFTRAAHLAYVAMPGGAQAVREPWRMALAHLQSAGVELESSPIAARHDRSSLETLARMIARGLNSPLTSSMGRLFDAIGAIAGAGDRASYEGQVAIRLESLASEATPDGAYPFDLVEKADGPIEIDVRPLVREAARDAGRGVSSSIIARRFHSAIVDVVARVCARIRETARVDQVALSGGVFCNEILLREATERLSREGFRVHRHRLIPPNDGGIAYGQLAVAAARDVAPHRESSACV